MDKGTLRAEIAVTRNSPGWQYILQIAEKLVAAKINEALEEEDEKKGGVLRIEARARRKMMDHLKILVDATVSGEFDPNASPEDTDGSAHWESLRGTKARRSSERYS